METLAYISYPWLKPRGLQLVRTLARGWETATLGRLTSGNYPYYAHRRIAAHMERRHKLYMPGTLPFLMPIHAWSQSKRETVSSLAGKCLSLWAGF